VNGGQIVEYVIFPLTVFFLTAIGTGVVGIIKLTVYFAHTREAQETTAKNTQEMAADLKGFIGETNDRLNRHGEQLAVHNQRISVVERIAGVGRD